MRDHRGDPADESDLEAFINYNLKQAYMIVQADFRAAQGVGGLSAGRFLCCRWPCNFLTSREVR